MTDVQITLTVPQAAQQVGNALVQILSDIKAKKSVTADAIALVETAMADFSELKVEAADPNLVAYAGLLAGQLVGVLVAPVAAPAAATTVASS